jgi:hypothetical protein
MPTEYKSSFDDLKGDNVIHNEEADCRAFREATVPLRVSSRGAAKARGGGGGALARHPGGDVRIEAIGARRSPREAGDRRPQ